MPLPPTVTNNFGLGLVGTSKDNLVEQNRIGGNINGIYIGPGTQGGNIISRNIIVGNPSIQDSITFGASVGVDIKDLSNPDLGLNTFEGNRCLTYMGRPEPAPCPNISKPDNDEDRQEADMTAIGATTPFQHALQHVNLGRNRLAFPQARLIDAVFHGRLRPLPNAAGRARPAHTAASDSVTVTGKVVDAACFMLHVAWPSQGGVTRGDKGVTKVSVTKVTDISIRMRKFVAMAALAIFPLGLPAARLMLRDGTVEIEMYATRVCGSASSTLAIGWGVDLASSASQ